MKNNVRFKVETIYLPDSLREKFEVVSCDAEQVNLRWVEYDNDALLNCAITPIAGNHLNLRLEDDDTFEVEAELVFNEFARDVDTEDPDFEMLDKITYKMCQGEYTVRCVGRCYVELEFV